MYEKRYLLLRKEADRIKDIDPDVLSRQYQTDVEVRRQARSEISFYNNLGLVEEGHFFSPEQRYYEYFQSIRDIEFSGKIIIKPYNSLYSCIIDSIKGCYDVSLVALSLMAGEGDFLFSVKIPGREDKAFAYVLFDEDGNIKRARHAFNLDVTDSVILKYLNLFAKDILLPSLSRKRNIHIS